MICTSQTERPQMSNLVTETQRIHGRNETSATLISLLLTPFFCGAAVLFFVLYLVNS